MLISLLSVSAFADFSSTDSSNLSTLKNNSTYGGKSIARWLSEIWIKCDTYFPSLGQIEVATKSTARDVSDIVSTASSIKDNTDTMVFWLSDIADDLVSSQGTVAYWARQIKREGLTYTDTDGTEYSAAKLLWSIRSRMIADNVTLAESSLTTSRKTSGIFDILNADKEKQEDALGDYSSSGGRSASNTSSDVGAISGSLSNSFNSGVSASSALNAVDNNQSDFQYFFFNMKNDLNTTGGGASRAPARGSKSAGSGSQVPDFLSDYWGGLNG